MNLHTSHAPARSADASRATLVLGGVAIASTLLYLIAFTWPYSLFKLYTVPKLAVYRFAREDPTVIWWLAAAFVVQCGLYYLGWRAAQHAHGRTAWAIVLGGALASGIVLLFVYPFDAADIFDYIMHGRIASVYAGNPFRDVAAQFSGGPFYPYAGWQQVPSYYGPAWEWIAAGVTRLTGDGIITNVLAFKVVVGVFLAGCVWTIWAILRRAAPERTLAGVTFFAWNPVVLYVTLGNGHNDVAMVLCILLAVLALLQQRYTLTILALVLGALFKFIPLLLIPAAGLIALRSLGDARVRLRFVALSVVGSVALAAVLYAPFWYGPRILDMTARTRLFTASLPAFFYTWLRPLWGQQQAASVVSSVALALTALFVCWQSIRAWRNPSWLGFSHAALHILLFYLMVTCAWFQQWYTVWPLAIAALLPAGPAIYLSLILSGYALLSKQLLFGPLIYRLHPFPGEFREVWFGPTVLGVPWLCAFFLLVDGLYQKIARENSPTA